MFVQRMIKPQAKQKQRKEKKIKPEIHMLPPFRLTLKDPVPVLGDLLQEGPRGDFC